MSLSLNVVWRVRVSGVETNGGGYDATVAGAGTDYSQQDAPQLSVTDLATAGTSATCTSTAAGFTSAMVGNAIRIASGTNFIPGYYMITTFNSPSSVTLDQNCSSGAGSAGVAKVGGAFASLVNFTNGGSGLATPALATPLLSGHTIYIRGSGSNDPSSSDYDYSAGYWQWPNGLASLPITIIGENGRPRISAKLLDYHGDYFIWKNISFFAVSPFAGEPIVSEAPNVKYFGCIFDQNGVDQVLVWGDCVYCYFKNTGSASAGTSYAHYCRLGTNRVCFRNVYDGLRGGAIREDGGATILNNIIRNLKGTATGAIYTTEITSYDDASVIVGNTIDGNAGYGYLCDSAKRIFGLILMNNIISNNASIGLCFNIGSAALNDRSLSQFADYNNVYNNGSARANASAGANDKALDPQFVDASGGNFAPGINMRNLAFQTWPALSTTSFGEIGAAQRQTEGRATLVMGAG